ncbi:hypothetical protein [Actinomadura sediminis]|uniref:Uncharacterized protein n=1 Tax=Actinomadura sediminis TaxID=1038904 RepID=A0ABW3EZ20_9ACTN
MASSALALVMPWAAAAVPAHAAESAPEVKRDHPGPHHWMYTNDDRSGGKVDFWPQGDIVRISDLQDEGAAVEVTIRNVTKDPDAKEYKRTFEGAGWGKEFRASMGQPYNMAEKHCFWFRIRLVKNGSVIAGSKDTAQWRNYNNTKKECPGVD